VPPAAVPRARQLLSRPHRAATAPARAATAAVCHPLCARARRARAAELASSGAPVATRTRAGAAREAGRLAALTLTPEQAVFNRRLLVLGLAVYAGYWREIDACIGVCKELANDTAKDGLLHLTMFYAARDAAKADAAYTGERTFFKGPPQQWTRLHQAARVGRAGRVAVLVAAAADVNARDGLGRTALYWSSERGHDAVVTTLLACPGIDVNLANVDGWTPLTLASYHGSTAVVAALLACPGVDASAATVGGYTPLYYASLCGHTAVVAALLAHPGILVNAVTTNGWTPLKIAKPRRGRADIVALLVAAGGVD
jgi:hypothetical protein